MLRIYFILLFTLKLTSVAFISIRKLQIRNYKVGKLNIKGGILSQRLSVTSDAKDIDQANWEESYMKTRVQVPFTQIEDIDSCKLIQELKLKGVARLNGLLKLSLVADLRDYILTELRSSAIAANEDSSNINRLFGNIKMTDKARWDLKLPFDSIVIDALRSILQKETILSEALQGLTDENGGGEFYELSSFVTTSGAKRQVIHSDTLWSEVPSLFTVMIALQDTDMTMGPTVFIPESISEEVFTKRVFDHWTEPLSGPHLYSDLNAGDAAIYDSRILHCGGANRSHEKPARVLFYFTIRCSPRRSKKTDEKRGMNSTPMRKNGATSRGTVFNLRDFL
jgi:hypothetical protein